MIKFIKLSLKKASEKWKTLCDSNFVSSPEGEMARGPYCARSSLGLAQHIRARPSAACPPGPESPRVESAQLALAPTWAENQPASHRSLLAVGFNPTAVRPSCGSKTGGRRLP